MQKKDSHTEYQLVSSTGALDTACI